MDAFQQWMVESNLEKIRKGSPVEQIVSILRFSGYYLVAETILSKLK